MGNISPFHFLSYVLAAARPAFFSKSKAAAREIMALKERERQAAPGGPRDPYE
jgi:hypothetical protein